MLAGPCADGTFDRFEFAAFNDWARRDAIEDAQFDGAGRHRFDAGPGRARDQSAECPGKCGTPVRGCGKLASTALIKPSVLTSGAALSLSRLERNNRGREQLRSLSHVD